MSEITLLGILQVSVVVFFGYITYLFCRLYKTGKRLRRTIPPLVAEHKKLSKHTLRVLIVAIVVTEIMVRVKGGSQYDAAFFQHIIADGCFLILFLVTIYWVNGLKNPLYHRALAYATIFLYAAVLWTGLPLLFR
jgi:hypothetical protein